MEKSETVERQRLHTRIVILMIIIIQVSFKLEPQTALDAFLRIGDNEMMLLDVGHVIENEVRAANIGKLWINLDLDSWQFFREKNILLNESLWGSHRLCLQ